MSEAATVATPKKWMAPFLAALADTARVRSAAAAAGITWSTAYRHRKSDPEFAAAWDDAEREAAVNLQSVLYERAVEKDTTAAIFLLKNLWPERFGDTQRIEHAGTVNLTELVVKVPE